jgi:hypothetical protein
MFYPERSAFQAKIQAPFVLAQINALKASIFKSSAEIQTALSVADSIAQRYELTRPDLFIPARETFGAILEPLSNIAHAGTIRRIGLGIFPQYMKILGVPAGGAKAALGVNTPSDLVRNVCEAYGRCVTGPGAGALTPTRIDSKSAVVSDTTFVPCSLQSGVFIGAGQITGLKLMVRETQCRLRGHSSCIYEIDW